MPEGYWGVVSGSTPWVGRTEAGWKQDWAEGELKCNSFAYGPQPIPQVAQELGWLLEMS